MKTSGLETDHTHYYVTNSVITISLRVFDTGKDIATCRNRMQTTMSASMDEDFTHYVPFGPI